MTEEERVAIRSHLRKIIGDQSSIGLGVNLEALETGPMSEIFEAGSAGVDREINAFVTDLQWSRRQLAHLALIRLDNGIWELCAGCNKKIDHIRREKNRETPFCGRCQNLLQEGRLQGFNHLAPPRPAWFRSRPA